MIMKHFKRIKEELNATYKIAKLTSIRKAIDSFIGKIEIQRLCRNGFKENPDITKRLLRKHQAVMEYLKRKYSNYWSSYSIDTSVNQKPTDHSETIWVCWWQGEENAPEIVRHCIKSIRSNSGDNRVVLITEENFSEYVEFPDYILDKYRSGVFSKTHFSDLLRFNLLATHGGMWLDATFFAIRPINEVLKKEIWTIKRPDYNHGSVAGGYFSNYSIACNSQNRHIYKTALDFLLEYWKHNDGLIDYLLVDYSTALSQFYFPEIAAKMNEVTPNNKNCDELAKVLGNPYSESIWNQIKENTDLFKLTWKQDFPKNIDGVDTFYGKLIKNELS